MTVLVEGFDPDQIALAAHLATRRAAAPHRSVRLAGAGAAPPEALALAAYGVRIEQHLDLDADPGPAEIAYLDVWTPAVAPRVDKLRARGARVTNLGDLLLERATGITVGVTGTAGKTTTTSIAVQLLRGAGVQVDASTTGRLGNVWPTAELLDREDTARPLVLELTSSHLAFMRESPRIAAITCFWPDHLELHGSFEAYRAAKETIVRGQASGATVVVNADDPAAAAFAEITPADLVEVSLERPVATGVFIRDGAVVLGSSGAETVVAPRDTLPFAGVQLLDLLVALAIAVAAGAAPEALDHAVAHLDLPDHRARRVAVLDGVAVIDDGMAATPSKTAAALAAHRGAGVVLIAGGIDDLGAGLVHASPEEQALLERGCDMVARHVRLVVLFGAAAARLEPLFAARRVPTLGTRDLDEAYEVAIRHLEQAEVLLFSPMFPVTVSDRERFAALAQGRQAGG